MIHRHPERTTKSTKTPRHEEKEKEWLKKNLCKLWLPWFNHSVSQIFTEIQKNIQKICASCAICGCNSGKSIFALRREAQHFSQGPNVQQLKPTHAWALALSLTLLSALLWQTLTPPWTAPDEPGHFLYVRLYAETGRPPTPAGITPAHWQALLASLEASGWQTYIHGHNAPAISHDPVLAASGLQVGQKAPGYYALAAAWLKLHPHWQTLPLVAQWRWLRWLSVLLRLATTSIALLLARNLWPGQPQKQLNLGLLTGLLPMVGFIGGSLNNDALTLLWGAASFSALVLAASRPAQLLMLLLVGLGPLLIDISLLMFWPLTLLRYTFWRDAGPKLHLRAPARSRYAPLTWLLILLPGLLLLPNPRYAAGWRYQHLNRTRREGQLFLAGADDVRAQMVQILSGKQILRQQGQNLHLVAHINNSRGPLMLRLQDASHSSEIACPENAQPHICQLTHTLSPGSQHISLSARAPAGPVSFSLRLTNDAGHSLLKNGSGQRPALLGAPLFTTLEQHLPLPAGYFSHLFSPGIWSIPALMRYTLYAGFTWASFWGYFGWLNRPWPWSIYLLLGLTTLAAIAGYKDRHLTPLQRLAALALLLILLQTWLPMLGSAWQPQGRYLFPALLPINLLLLEGWQQLLGPQRTRWLPQLLLPGLMMLNLLAWWVI